MHIALVAKYPLPNERTIGGVERVVEIFRRALSRRAKVTLLVPNAAADVSYRDEDGEIIYLRRSVMPQSLSYWTVASKALRSKLSELNPDIVHVHDLAGLAFTWSKSVGGARPQLIFTAHGVLEKDILHSRGRNPLRRLSTPVRAWMVGKVEQVSRRRYDRIVVINNYIMEAHPDIKALQWIQISNPVDQVFLQPIPSIRPNPVTIQLLLVGVVERRKNITTAVDILKSLIDLGVSAHLHVVGQITDANYRGQCEQLADASGIADALTFHGPASPATLVEWMDRADALLLTSKQETAPLVVAEAHCRGLPCVAPRAFGLVSMIDEFVDGIFIEGGCISADAARIRDLVNRRLSRVDIRRNALARYDEAMIVEQTAALYAKCLKTVDIECVA